MSALIGSGISHAGIFCEDWQFPFYLDDAIVAADSGKAVSFSDAAHTVKLAADGDVVIGRLETVEIRVVEGIKIGTVALKGGVKLPYKTGETMVLGGAVQGAGSGEVKPLPVTTDGDGDPVITIKAASHNQRNIVTAINTTAKTVEVILL